jgi:hypothetical protein
VRASFRDKRLQIVATDVLPSVVHTLFLSEKRQGDLMMALGALGLLFHDSTVCKREILSLASSQKKNGSPRSPEDAISLPFLLSEYIAFTDDTSLALIQVGYKDGERDFRESVYYHALRALEFFSHSKAPSPLSLFFAEKALSSFSALASRLGNEKDAKSVRAICPKAPSSLPYFPLLSASVFLKTGEYERGYEEIKKILSGPLDIKSAPLLLFIIVYDLIGARAKDGYPYFVKREKCSEFLLAARIRMNGTDVKI